MEEVHKEFYPVAKGLVRSASQEYWVKFPSKTQSRVGSLNGIGNGPHGHKNQLQRKNNHKTMPSPQLGLFEGLIVKMRMSLYGLSSLFVLTFSMCVTTSIPLITRPNTECFPSKNGVGT